MDVARTYTEAPSGFTSYTVTDAGPITMDTFTAVGIAEGWMDPEGPEQEVAAWQHLHDTGLAYQMQGWFGRTCRDLLTAGVINI